MFNIQFDGANSSQGFMGKFNIGKRMEDLFCRKEDIPLLLDFLKDIRTMDEEEYVDVIEYIKSK